MRSLIKHLAPLALAAVLATPVVMTTAGCEGHVRYYDADHGDYRTWDNNEAVYYGRWETETHRDHQDFNRRSDNEKKQYWAWRHNQNDNHH